MYWSGPLEGLSESVVGGLGHPGASAFTLSLAVGSKLVSGSTDDPKKAASVFSGKLLKKSNWFPYKTDRNLTTNASPTFPQMNFQMMM